MSPNLRSSAGSTLALLVFIGRMLLARPSEQKKSPAEAGLC
jgi:hypothetical protein